MSSVKVAVRVRPFNERELQKGSQCIIKMNDNTTYIRDPVSHFTPRKLVRKSSSLSTSLTGRTTVFELTARAIMRRNSGHLPTSVKNRCLMNWGLRCLITLGRDITHVCLLMDRQEVERAILSLVMERILGSFQWFARRYLSE